VSGGLAGTVVAASYGSQRVFGNRLDGLGTSATWKPGEAGMRVDFTTPVTTVRVDAIGTVTGDRARLEAYDRFGMLIGRYTTNPLADGQLETMQIQRPTPDIAYVIADAHSGIAVRLDRLRFGPESAVKTDAQGAYAIRGLVAGQYFVEAVSPSGRVLADSRREVTLAEGEALGSVDLVAHTGAVSWQNPVRPTDVNGDGAVIALDALVLINYINAHNGDVSLPADELPPPYLDVDGNGLVTAADVLAVINQLNTAATSSSGAGGELPASFSPEGESSDVVGLTMLSPSFAPPLTVAPARAAGDAYHETTMASFELPPVGSDSVPSWLHHVVHSAVLPAPVRGAATSSYVITACQQAVPRTPAEVLAADEMSSDADLEDLLSVLAEDLRQSRAGSL
jgi:hypothetical protein